MRPKRADVPNAAQTFIEKSNPKDETFALNFNYEVAPGLPAPSLFSNNIEELRSALNRGVPRGRTALNDAVVVGLKQLELGRRDRKALTLISDGGDNASEHTRAARVGGGEALFPASPSERSALCNGIANEIRSPYTVGYIPQPDKTPLQRIQSTRGRPGQRQIDRAHSHELSL